MATADLGEDSRDVGVGETPQEAVRAALRSLGEQHAGEMAGGAEMDPDAWQAKSSNIRLGSPSYPIEDRM
jgi:hypothetical protein